MKDISTLEGFKPISGLKPLGGNRDLLNETDGTDSGEKTPFVDFLKDRLSQVNDLGLDADKKMESALLGEEVNPHATMIAMQKADIAFSLLLSVKQRLETAYQTLIRMPIG
ncbi:MAG: flagellar hook-basal body complex protein FliE [Deltaproteobacteria bacterium]|nr:flagellar hook-basal body complex protein FliE [Deltaproteobacteria bacterium]